MPVTSLHARLIHIIPLLNNIFVRLKLFSNGTCPCKSITSKNIQSDVTYI